MLTNYQERKNEALVEYERFQKTINEFKNIVVDAGLPDPTLQIKTSLDDAERKAENIRADRFRLMVAGEAKSGKSTFINAYLGIDLMPMDVKQCTSSIVEIKYGEQLQLVATYADGKKSKLSSEDKIRDFLNHNAALDDDYRDIPVPTINHDILVRYGRRSKNGSIYIPKDDISRFLAARDIQAANIHGIDNYNRKIRNYIEQRKNQWQKIVVKIELFFPFEDEALKGIEIIDSPGVCARGGVEEITSSYIEKADAIIFLKPISGQALESSQFNEFMKNASVERNRRALFLVLTRATNVTPADLKRLEDEAARQFKQLDKRNIIIVDSKAELYKNEFTSVDDVNAHIQKMNAEGTLDEFVKGTWFDAMGDKNAFIKGLEEKSNFYQINEALSVFGRKAHYLALSSLLAVVARTYTRIMGDLNSHVARFKEKAVDPTELAKKIGEIKQELELINNKMYRGVNEIVSSYSSDDSSIKKNAESETEKFKKGIEKIDPNADDAFEQLELQTFQKIDVFKKLQESIQQEVVAKCNAELVKISDVSEIPYTSLEPDFSEKAFEKIKESTKQKAEETHSYETGVTFKKSHSHSEYSRNKHFQIVKDSILTRLNGIKNDLISNLVSFVNQISEQYMSKLKDNADAKKAELDAIYEAKLNAEQIQDVIVKIKKFEMTCSNYKSEADRLRGGIDKYVQQSTRTQS